VTHDSGHGVEKPWPGQDIAVPLAIRGPFRYHCAMTALKQPSLLTIAEYLDGEENSTVKHEYLGGTVHAMAGATNQHNAIAISSIIALGSQLRGKSCQPFNSDTKIRLEFPDHTRFYYPDAMVVCHPNPPAEHFQDRPVLIIEVLSESTRRADLGEKRDAYLTIPSLKVLLFVESETPVITLHRRKPEGGFAIETHAGLDAVIPLPEIEAALPLAALYERVEL
jgi:Uma2 family endonuclease